MATVSIRDSTDLCFQSCNISKRRHISSQSKYDLVMESNLTIPALNDVNACTAPKPKISLKIKSQHTKQSYEFTILND